MPEYEKVSSIEIESDLSAAPDKYSKSHYESHNKNKTRARFVICFSIQVFLGVVFLLTKNTTDPNLNTNQSKETQQQQQQQQQEPNQSQGQIFPEELRDEVYDVDDFVNIGGNIPAFWPNATDLGFNLENEKSMSLETWGPCYPTAQHIIDNDDTSDSSKSWKQIIEQNSINKRKIEYPKYNTVKNYDKSGMCRPGFLIIGAGKCGTSSLYHYIVGHPRVLPATIKQVHYFIYYASRDISWYYSHFPTTEYFLSTGALMTGEAAPGYIPYPKVSHLVKTRMPGPKILTIAREPLDRAWSSYNYNYIRPGMDKINKGYGKKQGIPEGKSEEYYRDNHFFSFEEFIRIELDLLKECIKPGGIAEQKARETYSNWFSDEFDRREREGMPPMIDIIGHCYPKQNGILVPRPQWGDMIAASPERYINVGNFHLVEAFIGRGLYALQVDWWYALHPAQNNYLVCTEDLRERANETMFNVSRFLGLPDYDFTDVVGKGMYNVAGHKGYDKATSWEKVEEEHPEVKPEDIPLSDGLREELMAFVKPLNERLFELAGKRCPW